VEFVFAPVVLDRILDDSEQLFLLNWFHKLILNALLHKLRGGVDIRMACHDDDRDRGKLLQKK
jgi:hypothetical protein